MSSIKQRSGHALLFLCFHTLNNAERSCTGPFDCAAQVCDGRQLLLAKALICGPAAMITESLDSQALDRNCT